MTDKTLLEIGKISVIASTYENVPHLDQLCFEWVEPSPDAWYSDTNASIDITRDDAIKLIDALTAHFKL